MNDVFDAETGEKLDLFTPPPLDATSSLLVEIPVTLALESQQQQTKLESPSPAQRVAKAARAAKCSRKSLAEIRRELQRPGLADAERLRLRIELLETTKQNYARFIQTSIMKEQAREKDRETAMRLEFGSLSRERMQRRHDKERAFYRTQITRIRKECEMALIAAAANDNLLR